MVGESTYGNKSENSLERITAFHNNPAQNITYINELQVSIMSNSRIELQEILPKTATSDYDQRDMLRGVVEVAHSILKG